MLIGEAFVGDGLDAAHLNVVLGSRDGPVGTAWAIALATPSAGHAPFVVVAQPGLPVQPFTLFVNKARIDTEEHGRMTWGPAQAGVAAGVIRALEAELFDEPRRSVLIAATWVNPGATDDEAVFVNNRDATYEALDAAVTSRPSPETVTAAAGSVWNPFFRRR